MKFQRFAIIIRGYDADFNFEGEQLLPTVYYFRDDAEDDAKEYNEAHDFSKAEVLKIN